jgi:hypothetical protein
MAASEVASTSTIRIDNGKWAKAIPIGMLLGHEDKIKTFFHCTITGLLARGVKVKEFIECFRGGNYNHLTMQEMDFLLHTWVYCWEKKGHFE